MKLVVSRGGEPWARVNSTIRLLMFLSVPFLFTVFNLSVIPAGIVLVVCAALGICSRLHRGGKNLRVPVIALRIVAAVSLVVLYLPPVLLFGFGRNPALYAGKRFVYLHGVANHPENRLLLPEKLPRNTKDYYLFTQGIFLAQDYHPTAYLVCHTDAAWLEQFTQGLQNAGFHVSPPPETKPGEEPPQEHPEFPGHAAVRLQSAGISEDTGGAEVWKNGIRGALVNRKTGLLVVWT